MDLIDKSMTKVVSGSPGCFVPDFLAEPWGFQDPWPSKNNGLYRKIHNSSLRYHTDLKGNSLKGTKKSTKAMTTIGIDPSTMTNHGHGNQTGQTHGFKQMK